jgi:protein-S-isoprenylcysteine O-methyltransferase Ste14
MKNLLVFLYSVIAYAIGMGGLVWFILFQGDFLLPQTVNTGIPVAIMAGLAVNIGLMLLWGVQHSVMARPGFKAVLTKLIPSAAERSTYSLGSGLCLVAIVLWWQGNSTVVWQFAGLELPLRILSFAGWGITVWATFEIDHFDLFGLKEPFCKLSGRDYKQRDFVTPFLYRYVRHPIQSGVLLGMWSQALMTQGQLILTVTMTIYVFVGLYFEEKDLVRHFGKRYLSYMQQVPGVIPRPGKRVSGDTTVS